MGLDIMHIKASLSKPSRITLFSDNYISRRKYDSYGFDVKIDYFNNYLQEIEIPKIKRILILGNNIENLNKAIMELNSDEDTAYLDKEIDFLFDSNSQSLISKWHDFEKRNFLSKMGKNEFECCNCKCIDYYELVKEAGFYTTEIIGYQRKGMNKLFRKRFYVDENIYCFTKKEDFDFAYKCIGFYWESDTYDKIEETKKRFKLDFIDKYEYGRSWMSLSY